MAPAGVLGPILRVIGYTAFLVWCVLVACALSALSLVRLGRLAGRSAFRPA